MAPRRVNVSRRNSVCLGLLCVAQREPRDDARFAERREQWEAVGVAVVGRCLDDRAAGAGAVD